MRTSCTHAHMLCQFPNLRQNKFPVFFAKHSAGTYHLTSSCIFYLLQQHNIYYTSSGPTTKVSNVKREKRKVKEKKGE